MAFPHDAPKPKETGQLVNFGWPPHIGNNNAFPWDGHPKSENVFLVYWERWPHMRPICTQSIFKFPHSIIFFKVTATLSYTST